MRKCHVQSTSLPGLANAAQLLHATKLLVATRVSSPLSLVEHLFFHSFALSIQFSGTKTDMK